MIRRPKIPEAKAKKLDPDKLETEVKWLEKRKNNKLVYSVTPGEWWSSFVNSIVISIILGGSVGALFGAFLKDIRLLYLIPLLVFIISMVLSGKKYAFVELDPETRTMLYEGLINYAGEIYGVRYLGPIEVVEGVQLVRHSITRKYYIRFATNSGYLRIIYNPKQTKFLDTLEKFELIDQQELSLAVKQNKILRKVNKWHILFEKKFDRTEYKEKLKLEKEEKERKHQEELKRKREELIKKSKKRTSDL